jgi:chorismate lyase/3-hydroxybenzoate synthase
MTSLGNPSALDSARRQDFGAREDRAKSRASQIIVDLPCPDARHTEQNAALETLFQFDFADHMPADAQSGAFTIALPVLDRPDISECWLTPGHVQTGQDDGIRFAISDHYLFAHLICDESYLDNTEHAVQNSYTRLLNFCNARDFKNPVRTWNFMPNIHHDDGLERYRRFSVGRAHAFDMAGLTEDRLPAGTAIGTTPGTPLCISLLATKAPLRMVNNSRQVDAFRYPSQYGPRSPSFSRAVLIPGQSSSCLLVSGTASVVGHQSLHHGDAAAQAKETCANIAHLIADARRDDSAAMNTYARAAFKVYVRRPEDLDIVRSIHEAHFGAAPTIYLQGDICRQELLLETEAAIWF